MIFIAISHTFGVARPNDTQFGLDQLYTGLQYTPSWLPCVHNLEQRELDVYQDQIVVVSSAAMSGNP